ncbi:MAG: hypothetical protein QXQ02_00230 [Halobacteria archaeon]
MPEKIRTICCGYDPMLVRGYVRTGEQALWFYLPKELYEDYQLKPGDTVKGTLHKVYDYSGAAVATPEEKFEWKTSRNSGRSVLLPGEVIKKYQLTAWHYVELTVDKVVTAEGEKEVYPGKTMQRIMWPEEKMKNPSWKYSLKYVG